MALLYWKISLSHVEDQNESFSLGLLVEDRFSPMSYSTETLTNGLQ